jgi:hypothetical protein
MRNTILLGVALVCVVAVAVAATGKGGHEPQLSDAYLAAAKAPCERFNSTVEPVRVGAGFDELLRQIDTFSTARAALGDDLRTLATTDDDRQRVEPLLDKLAEGNRVLSAAKELAGDGRLRPAYNRLDDFGRVSDAQDRLALRLGLGSCG